MSDGQKVSLDISIRIAAAFFVLAFGTNEHAVGWALFMLLWKIADLLRDILKEMK